MTTFLDFLGGDSFNQLRRQHFLLLFFKAKKRTVEKNAYCLAAKEVLTFQKKIDEMCTNAAAKHSST